jgi:hypothetical protein
MKPRAIVRSGTDAQERKMLIKRFARQPLPVVAKTHCVTGRYVIG